MYALNANLLNGIKHNVQSINNILSLFTQNKATNAQNVMKQQRFNSGFVKNKDVLLKHV